MINRNKIGYLYCQPLLFFPLCVHAFSCSPEGHSWWRNQHFQCPFHVTLNLNRLASRFFHSWNLAKHLFFVFGWALMRIQRPRFHTLLSTKTTWWFNQVKYRALYLRNQKELTSFFIGQTFPSSKAPSCYWQFFFMLFSLMLTVCGEFSVSILARESEFQMSNLIFYISYRFDIIASRVILLIVCGHHEHFVHVSTVSNQFDIWNFDLRARIFKEKSPPTVSIFLSKVAREMLCSRVAVSITDENITPSGVRDEG